MEARPLVIVSAATPDGAEHSVILQNAETVKLVGPVDADAGSWQTLPVTDMAAGDVVLVRRSAAGRHMGMAVQEQLSEL